MHFCLIACVGATIVRPSTVSEIIPIIAMSANAFSEDIMDSRLAGMDIHLAKPLDEAKMINALKQCIAERSAVKLRNDL